MASFLKFKVKNKFKLQIHSLSFQVIKAAKSFVLLCAVYVGLLQTTYILPLLKHMQTFTVLAVLVPTGCALYSSVTITGLKYN